MFKARIFTPPRLCAVFEIAGTSYGSSVGMALAPEARSGLDDRHDTTKSHHNHVPTNNKGLHPEELERIEARRKARLPLNDQVRASLLVHAMRCPDLI